MADIRQLETALVNADKAGDVDAARTLAREITRVRAVSSGSMADLVPGQKSDAPVGPAPVQAPPTAATRMLNVFGPAEGALSLGTGMVGSALGQIVGVGNTILSGKIRGPESIQVRQKTADDVSRALTYQPRTESGQEQVRQFSNLLHESKLAGLGPTEAIALGGMIGPATSQVTRGASSIETPNFMRPAPIPQMVGMGAAETAVPALRIERARQLPIPMKLTKGQATRSFEQQQFEREAAKNPTIGEPLRQRFAEQNQQIPRNLEFFLDETGAQSGSLRATGQLVSDAIVEKAKKAKGRIDAAYQAAREAGETQEAINVAPLVEYLEGKRPQFINAGVLPSTLDELSASSGKTGGFISIDDLEEIRKSVGRAGDKDATNAHYARDIKKQIDALTEGKGGEEYKYARRLRKQYGDEFEDIAIIDRLISTKPGTRDRQIAFEDVFDRSIMGGSLDDVRSLRKTLQTGGVQGEQAWKELQGATVAHIKDEITKNSARDINGNPVVSAAQFNKIVTGLDKDGKLDFIFGKQGAQKMRDLRDISLDTLTSPPGSVNTSNTASVVLAAMDTIISGASGMPLPVLSAARYAGKKIKDVKLGKRVGQALNP